MDALEAFLRERAKTRDPALAATERSPASETIAPGNYNLRDIDVDGYLRSKQAGAPSIPAEDMTQYEDVPQVPEMASPEEQAYSEVFNFRAPSAMPSSQDDYSLIPTLAALGAGIISGRPEAGVASAASQAERDLKRQTEIQNKVMDFESKLAAASKLAQAKKTARDGGKSEADKLLESKQVGTFINPDTLQPQKYTLSEAVSKGLQPYERNPVADYWATRGAIERDKLAANAKKQEKQLGLDKAKNLNQLAELREKHKGIREFQDVDTAYNNINRISSSESRIGVDDVALMMNYLKLLDPDSVVRESEQLAFMNARSPVESAANIEDWFKKGNKLSPTQVQAIKERAYEMYLVQREKKAAIDMAYENRAKALGGSLEGIISQTKVQTGGKITGKLPDGRTVRIPLEKEKEYSSQYGFTRD